MHHYASYHSSSNFALPNDFIPEQCLGDTRFAGDSKDVLQPFSYGPRGCLGKKYTIPSLPTLLKLNEANNDEVSHMQKSNLSYANYSGISMWNFVPLVRTG